MSNTNNTIFNVSELYMIPNVLFKQIKRSNRNRTVLFKRELTDLEYNVLPIATNAVRNAVILDVEVPVNLLVYKGVVVSIEFKHFDTSAESLLLVEKMPEHLEYLYQFFQTEEMLDKEVYADLNGIYWKGEIVNEDSQLTKDGALYGVPMSMIYFKDIHNSIESALTPRLRYAIKYELDGLFAITTPIFKDKIGNSVKGVQTDDGENLILDRISENHRINLNYLIVTAKKLTKFVDYEEVDRMFQIAEIVISLGVESLPKIPKATKYKYPIPLSVKDCIIWLLGLQTRYGTEDIKNLEVIRQSIKFLLSKGLTEATHSDIKNLLMEGCKVTDIKYS